MRPRKRPQRCVAVYAEIESGGNVRRIRCVKEAGHTGNHEDAWGRSPPGVLWLAGSLPAQPRDARWLPAAKKVLAALRELQLQIPGSRDLTALVKQAESKEET